MVLMLYFVYHAFKEPLFLVLFSLMVEMHNALIENCYCTLDRFDVNT